MTLWFDTCDSPIGRLTAAADPAGLRYLLFPSNRYAPERAEWVAHAAPFAALWRQLDAYFAGQLKQFDLPLAARGTPFQKSVWEALLRIPYGRTWSYGELAAQVGNPNASRAVGLANGRNPLPILVPCHRVIGANGSLTGFGGGIETKRALLDLERGERA